MSFDVVCPACDGDMSPRVHLEDSDTSLTAVGVLMLLLLLLLLLLLGPLLLLLQLALISLPLLRAWDGSHGLMRLHCGLCLCHCSSLLVEGGGTTHDLASCLLQQHGDVVRQHSVHLVH